MKKPTNQKPATPSAPPPAPPPETKAVALSNVVTMDEATAKMLAEDIGAGFENASAEDFAIPRISLMQAQHTDKNNTAFVPGAEVGDIRNSVTGELYQGNPGVELILVHMRHHYPEWVPQNQGGGFVKDHGEILPEHVVKNYKSDKGIFVSPDGKTEVVPTYEYFALLIDRETGAANEVVISMAKTQEKHGKRLNSMWGQFRIPHPISKQLAAAPIFYRIYRLGSGPEKNKVGQTWMGWTEMSAVENVMTPQPTNTEDQAQVARYQQGLIWYQHARDFRRQVVAGEKKAAAAEAPADTASSEKEAF